MDNCFIRGEIQRFLSGCGLFYPPKGNHDEFEADIYAEAVRRQYVTDQNQSLMPAMPSGIAMACHAYHHQPRNIQVYICFYTAFLVYMDDAFANDVTIVREFNHRFITGQRQGDVILDHLAKFLLDTPAIFGTVEANIIMTSTLNLITALPIEAEFRDVKFNTVSQRFPAWNRSMSAAAEAYTIFSFTTDTALSWKLQALPDCASFIATGNDILSIYKEELVGETTNRVTTTARCRGIAPSTVLKEFVDETINATARVLESLAGNDVALEAWKAFAQGYVGFHTVARYRLDELELNPHEDTQEEKACLSIPSPQMVMVKVIA